MDEETITPGDVAVVKVTDTDPSPEDIAGVPNGFVDSDGETVVYDYDSSGNFVGWHKEAN